MHIIIVGTGNIALRHAENVRNLRPDAHVFIVGRQRPDGLPSWLHYADLLEKALALRPLAVILAHPCVFHVEDARRCLKQGCHVFIEKPFAHVSDGIQELIEEAQRRSLLLQVGYNLRHHACVAKIKQILQSGAIGQPITFMLEVGKYLPDWRPSKDYRQTVSARSALGGGALLELSHEFDTCVWLGGRVRAVTARHCRASGLDLDVEDCAQTFLTLESGAVAMIHLDFIQRPGGRRYRIIGSRGSLEWHSARNEVLLTAYEDATCHEFCCDEAAEFNHTYLAEMREFLHTIGTGDCAIPLSTYDAAHVVRIIEACRNSTATGTSSSL
ncbi:MAG: Gfo/Idh/MocA family protein [Verrucomicrobiaceae bacterium]